MIFIIDVSSDANGSFCDQTLFSRFLATNIVKDALSVGDHHIRNNLFKIRIGFSLGARQEIVVFWVKDCWQIAINISTETLKSAKPLES